MTTPSSVLLLPFCRGQTVRSVSSLMGLEHEFDLLPSLTPEILLLSSGPRRMGKKRLFPTDTWNCFKCFCPSPVLIYKSQFSSRSPIKTSDYTGLIKGIGSLGCRIKPWLSTEYLWLEAIPSAFSLVRGYNFRWTQDWNVKTWALKSEELGSDKCLLSDR